MISMLLHAAVLSATTAALPPQDGWLAFTGCWRAENAPPSSLVCFVPAQDGVRMLEIDNGVTRETRIIADGRQRPLSQEGCKGVESARWSADGERLFLNTELTCGDRTQRKTSGIFAFTLPNQWVSIQAVTVGQQGAANTARYFSVDRSQVPAQVASLLPDNRLARETARYAAAELLDFNDVKEALSIVEPRAVEALLVARQQPFTLNGKKLLALADEGVPDYIIDAMIAVSHPDVFEVSTAPAQALDLDQRAERAFRDPYDMYSRDRACGAFGYNPWSAYDPFGCRYGYGYSSYLRARTLGYSGYSPWDYYNPPVIIIRDRDQDEPSGTGGKATRNGYRRGGSSDSEHARPRDNTPSTSRPANSSTPSGSGSGSSSGSSSSGRTAKPRT